MTIPPSRHSSVTWTPAGTEPVSLVPRASAADQPRLGKRWADPALRRLADRGILDKRRPKGRANVPTWFLVVTLDEALRRL